MQSTETILISIRNCDTCEGKGVVYDGIMSSGRDRICDECNGTGTLNMCPKCPTCNTVFDDFSSYEGVGGHPASWWVGKFIIEHMDEQHS